MLSYAHCIREDPVRRGLLYLGTENALYVSFDDGDSWQPLQTNMPHAPVYWITVQEHFNDLVIATYGRGFWILDDITPLQQLTRAGRRNGRAPLSRRVRRTASARSRHQASLANDPATGDNPPYGASINYFLKSEPAGEVAITILDPEGQTVVRRLRGPKSAGLNRVHWDLRYEPTREVRLRTPPLYVPDVTVEPGRDAVRARSGTTVNPRAAGNLYRSSQRRGQTVHAEARSP